MTRGILIVGDQSPLFNAIAAEAALRTESYTTAMISSRFSDSYGKLPSRVEMPEKAIPLSWNPGSPISARTLVFSAENRMGMIHDAILVFSPPAIFKSVEIMTPEEIEALVNDHIKGWFLLCRELALYFNRVGSGSISLAIHDYTKSRSKTLDLNLFGQTAAASFKTFTHGLFAASHNEPYHVMGFSGPKTSDTEKFAAWLFAKIDKSSKKTSGKWYRYSRLFSH